MLHSQLGGHRTAGEKKSGAAIGGRGGLRMLETKALSQRNFGRGCHMTGDQANDGVPLSPVNLALLASFLLFFPALRAAFSSSVSSCVIAQSNITAKQISQSISMLLQRPGGTISPPACPHLQLLWHLYMMVCNTQSCVPVYIVLGQVAQLGTGIKENR